MSYKKATGLPRFDYDDAVTEALRLGWVDSKPRALDTDGKAAEYSRAFPPSTRRAILKWILSARKPGTRAKRVEETARLAAKNIRANQWRQPAHGGTVQKSRAGDDR